MSQSRPEYQIKPGNVIYLRVKDADRDLSNEEDQVVVKLTADSEEMLEYLERQLGEIRDHAKRERLNRN